MTFVSRIIPSILLLAAMIINSCHGFSMTMSTSSFNKGSAAKPFEKKKVAVFGTAGYLGAVAYGFLQRAGALYGTGISGVGAPRAIVATAAGSSNLNSVLTKNFALAFADESFVRPTDMTSVDSISAKLNGFDAAILATRYCFKTLPVTMGTYGKGPNDKTKEFFMDQPRSWTNRLMDDPEYSIEVFRNTLEACKQSGKIRHLVIVETDFEFDKDKEEGSAVGDKYLQLLEEAQIPYTYVRPLGKLENIDNFSFERGIQSELKISRAYSNEELSPAVQDKIIYREHIAAVCVQSLMTLGWEDNRVIQVEQSPDELNTGAGKVKPQKEWCVNSGTILNSLAAIP